MRGLDKQVVVYMPQALNSISTRLHSFDWGVGGWRVRKRGGRPLAGRGLFLYLLFVIAQVINLTLCYDAFSRTGRVCVR